MTKKQALKNWDNATEELTKIFCKKYFKDSYEYHPNDWVSNEIGGVIAINDYYFSFSHIKEALELNATEKQLFDYYDYSLDSALKNKKVEVNFKNYVKYFSGFAWKEK